MGDVTNGLLHAKCVPLVSIVDEERSLAELIADAADPIYNRYADRGEGPEIVIGGELSVGSSTSMASQLQKLIADTGFEFAFWVQEDPKFEWMGEACVYVPDVGFAQFECDSEGNPRPNVKDIVSTVMGAKSLEEAQRRVQQLSHQRVLDAWDALTNHEEGLI